MQLRGPQETCQRRKEKAKEKEGVRKDRGRDGERGSSDWKAKELVETWFCPPPVPSTPQKKNVWGCHFLILCSNALWRKFAKLDQGCLKLVYKRRRWRKEEEECRTPKAFETASISPTGWYSFFPFLFFRVVASAVRCHVFWHFALERMRG